jgi:hypothetical protein
MTYRLMFWDETKNNAKRYTSLQYDNTSETLSHTVTSDTAFPTLKIIKNKATGYNGNGDTLFSLPVWANYNGGFGQLAELAIIKTGTNADLKAAFRFTVNSKNMLNVDYDNGVIIYGNSGSGYFGLKVVGNGATIYTAPNTDGTNGQVLKTNGSGVMSWGKHGGTEYDFTVSAGGQTAFDIGVTIGVRYIQVFRNGVKIQSSQYSTATSIVTFTSTVPQNSWVQIVLF